MKYTYEGNRDPNNTSQSLVYDGETYNIGDDISISAAERDRLSPYFIFTDKEGEDVGEGLTAPTTEAVDLANLDEPLSESADTIPEKKSSPSASSKKS